MNPAAELPERARKAAASGARPETKSGRTPCHTLDHRGDGAMAPPAIRLVNYMGDNDDYTAANVIGPYPDCAARDTDLFRLRGLPLGGDQYRGGCEFQTATMADATGWDMTVVDPAQVADSTTVHEFFTAFFDLSRFDDLIAKYDCDLCGGYGKISVDVEMGNGRTGEDSIPCPRGCEDQT
jgi:hypothetical protein